VLLQLFSLQTFKKDDKYLTPLEIFSPPGCIGLATALTQDFDIAQI